MSKNEAIQKKKPNIRIEPVKTEKIIYIYSSEWFIHVIFSSYTLLVLIYSLNIYWKELNWRRANKQPFTLIVDPSNQINTFKNNKSKKNF